MPHEKLNHSPRHVASYWALSAVTALAACGKSTTESATQSEGDGDGVEATGGENGEATGGAGGTEDQVGTGGTEHLDPPAAGCPWVGYGEGLQPNLCLQMILSAHVTDTCSALGGDPSRNLPAPDGQATTLEISGDCGDEVQEVRMRCCPGGELDALRAAPMGDVSALDLSLVAESADDTRAILREGANARCESGGGTLSSWAIVYGEDAETAERIHFTCGQGVDVPMADVALYQCSSAMFTVEGDAAGQNVVFDATLDVGEEAVTFTWTQHDPFGTEPGVSGESPAEGLVSPTEIDVQFDGGKMSLLPLEGGRAGVLHGSLALAATTVVENEEVADVDFVCWPDGVASAFTYRPEDGSCRNQSGEEGLELVPLPMMRTTKNGECAKLFENPPEELPALDELHYLAEQNLGYPELLGWNLAGADLGGSGLYFAMLLGADLRGADLSAFYAGYHNLTGTVDEYTTGLESLGCSGIVDRYVLCCTVGGTCE